jgi:hypothetical protein
MKTVANSYILASIIAVGALFGMAQDISTDKVIASEFENHVREYTRRRESLESELPQLSKQATAEEITAHKSALLNKVLADRKGARRGDVFTPEAEKLIRSIIIEQYPARDRMELRKELAEAENKTVAVKVNAVYPEAAELVEMPPTLLLALPQLPKQVRYRFVGTDLLIVDRESHLIVDYMPNALP